MERFDVCPQPIWVFDASPEVMEESTALIGIKHSWKSRTSTGPKRPYSMMERSLRNVTDTQQYHKRDDTKIITAWFKESLNKVKLQYNMPYERLSISEMWLIRTSDGGFLSKHTHGLAVVSGIFYITDSPGTHFFRENLFANSTNKDVTKQLGFEGNADVPNSQEFIETQFPASAGKLVIFPSRLAHSIKPCSLPADHVRYTMAFNASMDGKCGFRGGPGFVDITVN